MDRLYRCKNKTHYIFATPKDDAVWCELCNKIYTFDDCDRVNIKTGRPYQKQLDNQLLPAVTNKPK